MTIKKFWEYHSTREKINKGKKYNKFLDFICYFGGMPFRYIKYKRRQS